MDEEEDDPHEETDAADHDIRDTQERVPTIDLSIAR